VLQRTATAGAEVRARRDRAFGARLEDLDRLAAPPLDLGQHPLSRQGQGNESRARRETVALRADGVDPKFSELGQGGNLYKKFS
jgi:hypothetical protein